MARFLRALNRILLIVTLLPAALPNIAASQTTAKKRVTSEADLPRFSYPVTASASDLLLSGDATFVPSPEGSVPM